MNSTTPLKRLSGGSVRHFYRYLLCSVIAACFLVLGGVLTPQVHALQTVPYTINYQGRLTDSSGNPMATGQYNMTFRLFSTSTGGTAVWSEVRDVSNQQVSITNGQFDVQLGTVTPLSPSLFTSQPLYFEVELPSPATATCSTAGCASYTEGPMTPRQALASSAYAMNSDTLDGIDSSSFARRDVANTYTNTQLVQSTGTSVFSVQQSGGASALTVNTTNQRVAVGNITTPVATLSVQTATSETLPALVVNNTGTGSIAQFQNSGTAILTVASTGTTLATTSSTAFSIQKAAASDTLFTADSTNNRIVIGNSTGTDTATTLFVLDSATSDPTTGVVNGAMYYNSTLGKFRCYQGGAFTNCIGSSGATSQQVTLAPEYANAVLSANGAANSNVNVTSNYLASLSSTQGYKHTFYQWNTSASTTQQYSIVVSYQLPSNFTSFVPGSFNIWTYADSLTSTGATFMLKSANGTSCYASAPSILPTTSATWQDKLPGDPGNGCTFAANDVITLIITPSVISPSTNNVDIGELSFAYQ